MLLICRIWKKLIEKKIRFVVTRGRLWGLGKLKKDGQKVQHFSYKINIIGNITYNTVNTAVWYI